MTLLDWSLVLLFAAWLAIDGLRHARRSQNDPTHWLVAGRRAPWWAMGLSIMATQASAITLVGTTGKGFEDGTRFAQFYYALPLAMLILGIVFLPFYQRERSFTAYDWLERRYGRPSRLAVAGTFLVQRALALGVVLSVPSVLLAEMTGLPYALVVVLTAAAAFLYTSAGGVAAVLSTDVKQMAVMLVGIAGVFVVGWGALPDGLDLAEAWQVSDALGRIELFDTSFDPGERYTVWSSLLGATVIFLAYFGTDQRQVQRYLAGRDLRHQRRALWFNGLAKIPLQIAILLLGVLLFLWSLAEPVPLHLSTDKRAVAEREWSDYAGLDAEHRRLQGALGERMREFGLAESPGSRAMASERLRAAHSELQAFTSGVKEREHGTSVTAEPETNYIVPWFLLNRLPAGLVGLLLAAILAAALSSIDSELAALSSVATIDICRLDPRDPAAARRIVWTSRLMTLIAAMIAASFAMTLKHSEAFIEKVNAVGSFFYGSLLGVFLMAIADRRARGAGLISGLVAGMAAVPLAEAAVEARAGIAELPFLYRNTVGLVTCLIVGLATSRAVPRRKLGA